FWVRSVGQELRDAVANLAGFRNRFGVQDEKSLELTTNPWEDSKPLQTLQQEPRRAFRLNPSMAQLRQVKDPSRVIGVERCAWGTVYEQLPPLGDKKPVDALVRQDDLVVDPDSMLPRDKTYRTLSEALEHVKPGSVIFIRHDGLMRVKP